MIPTLQRAAIAARQVPRRLSGWTGNEGLDKRLVARMPEGRGFFIEAGANDGLKQSNTYYLEKRRGWDGLLIEPVPRLAEKCRRNRRATVVNAALVPPDMEGADIELIDVDLMTIVAGARDEKHVHDGEVVQGIKRRTVKAPGRTFSSILAEMGDPIVDLLSLDVEGFELQALAGLDLDRHAPKRILVETQDIASVEVALGGRYENQGRLSVHDWLLVLR